jgi:hypothetical protein
MPKRVWTGLTRADILGRDIERFKQKLVKLHLFSSSAGRCWKAAWPI